MRDLTMNEVDEVNGGPIWVPIVGGIAGGAAAGGEAYSNANADGEMSGSDWVGVAASTAGGAVLGATGIGKALKLINKAAKAKKIDDMYIAPIGPAPLLKSGAGLVVE